jgi:hypothetical protein
MNRKQRAVPVERGNASEELDTLNARFRGHKDSPTLIRRNIEGELEAKARRRRKEQSAASEKLKRLR